MALPEQEGIPAVGTLSALVATRIRMDRAVAEAEAETRMGPEAIPMDRAEVETRMALEAIPMDNPLELVVTTPRLAVMANLALEIRSEEVSRPSPEKPPRTRIWLKRARDARYVLFRYRLRW
jgi:hypothetical protein